jgi:hypothetical protein
MSNTVKSEFLTFEIEKNHSLFNRVFSGCLFDNELELRNNGYIFDYYLGVRDYVMQGNKCIIKEADLCVGTRSDISYTPVDVQEEIKNIKKELEKNKKLSKHHPEYKDGFGVTYEDLARTYEQILKELESVSEPLLNQLKLQILDRINTDEKVDCKNIDFSHINHVTFSKSRMCGGKVRWKKVS